MPLRAVIIDLSDTLVQRDGKPVPGMDVLVARLRGIGLRIAVASNARRSAAEAALSKAGIRVDFVAAPDTIGAKKPSPRYCTAVAEHFGLGLHELVYIGDNDETDALACVNARVLYLSALWANPSPNYGLPVTDPSGIWRFVKRFLLTDPQWYWVLDKVDRRGRKVVVRALWKELSRTWSAAKRVLKQDAEFQQNGRNLRRFLFRLMLTRLYLADLIRDVDYWCWYPSSGPGPKSSKLQEPLEVAARLFRDRYEPDLLMRHAPAVKLASARANQGERPTFLSQMNTVCLNPNFTRPQREKLVGKHILVVDDFCTEGLSFECARNLLYAAGAERVQCVAFGRYWDEYRIQVPRLNLNFDPWVPNRFAEGDFEYEVVRGVINAAATEQHQHLVELVVEPLA